MSNTPFFEKKICDRVFIRTFDTDTPDTEFKWHFDMEDRLIIPLYETDWKFQLDNELPFFISSPISIKKDQWHRIIKGNGNLSIKVIKL